MNWTTSRDTGRLRDAMTLPSFPRVVPLLLVVQAFSLGRLPAQTEIPLTLINDGGYYRIGIELSIGGTGDYYSYIFDTGSQPLVVNSTVGVGSSTATGTTGQLSYGATAASTYSFTTYNGAVTLKDIHGDEHSVSVDFASLDGENITSPGITGGILGAGPDVSTFNTSGGFNLFSILGQIPVNSSLLQGFSISLHGGTPKLTLGIDPAKWAATPIKVAMQASTSTATVYPNTGAPIYNQDQIQGGLTLELGGESYATASDTPVKIDSGAPTAFYVTADSSEFTTLDSDGFLTSVSGGEADLADGTLVGLTSIPGYEYLVNSAEVRTLMDIYDSGTSGTYSHLNTGINPYFDYEITYLLDDGSGNGFVGFTPAPEPTTVWLVIAGALPLIFARRRQIMALLGIQ